MTGTEPTPHTEQNDGRPELQVRLERARAEALAVIGPALDGIERIEIRLGVPLVGNTEIRSEVDLPSGVVLASASTVDEMRGAERVITDREAERFYTDMAAHGVGREQDITLAEAGVPVDALQVPEGGLMHTKMVALKQMILEQKPALVVGGGDNRTPGSVEATKTPGDIVQLASKHRKVKPETPEMAAAVRLVNENQEVIARNAALFQFLEVDPRSPHTEWDVATVLWLSDPNFVLAEAPRIVGTVDVEGTPGGRGVSGSLFEVGSIHGRKVFLQQVPRIPKVPPESGEPVVHPDTKRPLYVQPNSSQFAAAHAEILGAESVAIATSATYLPETIAEITEVKFDRALADR
jgi:hypothetical protein